MDFFDILLYLILFPSILGFRFVGWYNGDLNGTNNIPYDIYTHIVTGSPTVLDNGTVLCNKSDILTNRIVHDAHQNNVWVQWRAGFDVKNIFNDSVRYTADNYVNSINSAMENCNIDGVEFDFEWSGTKWGILGIIPSHASNTYTAFLQDVKNAVGDKIVSADIGVWGVMPGSYVLGWFPWVNVTAFNSGTIDFLNTMSYHWNKEGSIVPWIKDYVLVSRIWKMDPKKVNLGIPYFNMNYSDFKIYNEPLWNTLSDRCPNSAPNLTVCDEITMVSKEMNYEIGKYAKRVGMGGLFPWTLNYDSFRNNNTLVKWAYQGYLSANR